MCTCHEQFLSDLLKARQRLLVSGLQGGLREALALGYSAETDLRVSILAGNHEV